MGTLTPWQRRRLEQQLRSTRDARIYRRTLAILEVGRGEPVADVARRLRVTRRAVHFWIGAYTREHDPDTLRDRERSGRPCQMTDRGREVLGKLLGRSTGSGRFAAERTARPLWN